MRVGNGDMSASYYGRITVLMKINDINERSVRVMSKSGIVKRIALIVSALMIFTVAVFPTVSYVITQTRPLTNTFRPTPYPLGQLTLNKTVEHPLGEGYTIPDAIKFLFNIDLGSDYAGKTLSAENGESFTADDEGNISVAVKPGSSLTLNGIFAGTSVTVTETDILPGFSVKDGQNEKNVIIQPDAVSVVDYINVYSPAEAEKNVALKGEKILRGRPWQEGDKFTFLLEYHTGDQWVSLGTREVEYDPLNDDFNKFDFSDALSALHFDSVGVYAFRMTEQAGHDEGVIYDMTVNHFNIAVTDSDMDGRLEISSVTASENAQAVKEQDGSHTVSVQFNNSFVPLPPVEDSVASSITVKKTVKNVGTASIGPEGFEFVLENNVSGEKTELKTDKNGNAIFDLLYTEKDIGVHTYKLYEVNTAVQNVTYSDKVYDVTVSVAFDDNGELKAVVSVDGQMTDDPVVYFENVYDADVDVPPTGDMVFTVIVMSLASSIGIMYMLTRKRRTHSTH